jgi:ATP-binding cassette subfamily F protein 3
MEELAPLRAAAEFSFEFREPERAPNPLLVLDQVDTGYRSESNEAKIIVGNITFTLQAGQRIGLLGVNGAGKSTLIKTIAGDLSPLSGEKHLGKGLVVGYFAQQQLEMLQHDDSPLMHLMRIAPNAREQELRDFLGRFNFPGDMVKSPIAPFSGGEKARLALALIVWQKPNLLLLDEPTNHLDLETREALTEALAQFDGTLILVSHDRHLLRATTDEFLIVADGQLTSFDGDLDDYRDWLFKTRVKTSASANEPSKTTTPISAPITDRKEEKRIDPKERQRLSNQRKPLEKRLQKIEAEISDAQSQKASIELTLADSTVYEEPRKTELTQLLEKQHRCTALIEQLESEWLQIQESLEQIASE